MYVGLFRTDEGLADTMDACLLKNKFPDISWRSLPCSWRMFLSKISPAHNDPEAC